MKKYFEYKFNEQIKDKLLRYYNSQKSMDNFLNNDKTALKIRRIEKYIPFRQNDIICDIGCANGSLLIYLNGKYARGVGLDISEKAIAYCRSSVALDNVSFMKYDGTSIKTKELFDKIFIMDVLEHAFEPDRLVSSIYDKLNPGGYLIIQVPATGWLSELVFGKYHYGHLRYYDETYLKKYLEGYGFCVEHIETFNSVPWASHFIKNKKLFSMLSIVCDGIPHKLYPYYGSVAAVAYKKVSN